MGIRTPGCDICSRLSLFDRGGSDTAVARLRSGYVWLFGLPYPRGYTLFAANQCIAELHQLERTQRALFLEEMTVVAEAVWRSFNPVKLNYELLGNSTRHLHWHLIPRQADEPHLRGPVWEDAQFLANLHGGVRAPAEEIAANCDRLLAELQTLGAAIQAP